MNTPLDDIYKDGLKNRSYEFQESDWLGAKHMLELQERKHKIPIWFWIGVGILSLAGMAHVQYSPLHEEHKEEEIIANLISESAPSEKSIFMDVAKQSNQPEGKKNNISEDTNEETSRTSNSKIGVIKSVSSNTDTSTNNLSEKKSRQDQPKNTDSKKHESSTIDENSTYPNTPVRQGQVFTNFRNTLRHPSSATTQSAKQTENQTTAQINGQTESNIQGNTINENNLEIAQGKSDPIATAKINNVSFTSTLSHLPILSILPFQLTTPTVELMDNKLDGISAKDAPYKKALFGIYIAHTIPSPNWSAGLQLEYPLFNRLHISGGIGLNWNSSFQILAENQESQHSANSGTNRVLNESINIQRLSLEMPISLIYKINRHELLGGVLLNKAVVSQRKNESSLISIVESFDPADPSMDLAEPITQNPITVNQYSVSTDDPALLKWDTYFTMGYGYAFNNRMGMRINGTYRFSKLPNIQSTLADTEYNLDIPKYSARITLLFNF